MVIQKEEGELEEFVKGSVTEGVCPRAGHVWLMCMGKRIVLPTNCKSWRCSVCQKKKAWVVRNKALYGVTRMERSFGLSVFITLTYRIRDWPEIVNVDTVAGDWKKLLSWWKNRSIKPAWMRIPELTKKGVPHLHILASWKGISDEEISCEAVADYKDAWRAKVCSCLEHAFSRQWFDVTGDSYVVDVKKVGSPRIAAAYVSKYLTKGMMNWDGLEKLGFTRRYSTSRQFPVGGVWLRGRELGWTSDGWGHNDSGGRYMALNNPKTVALDKMGDRLELEGQNETEKAIQRKLLKRFRKRNVGGFAID